MLRNLLRALLPKLCAGLLTAVIGWGAQANATPPVATSATPSDAEQDKMLQAMREYAVRYVDGLPNFICLQTIEQFEAGKKPVHWRQGDTLTAKLVFSKGREERTLELVNSHPMRAGHMWKTPLTTEGEFGILIAKVFGNASAATFTWKGWETVRGVRVAAFDYSIDQEHSTLKLTLSDLAQCVVPYRGSVYGDPETGQVWRITDDAFDIPPQVRVKSTSTTVEYSPVVINGANYLLPAEAIIVLSTGAKNIRNEMRFREYRKFETDSSITYTRNDPP